MIRRSLEAVWFSSGRSLALGAVFLIVVESARAQSASDPEPISDLASVRFNFDPRENGDSIVGAQFIYDLKEFNGTALKVGPEIIDTFSFFVSYSKFAKIEPPIAPTPAGSVLFARLPESWIGEGPVSIAAVNETGHIFWQKPITASDRFEWSQRKIRLAQSAGLEKPSDFRTGFWTSAIGWTDFDLAKESLGAIRETFFFCLTREISPKEKWMMCTPPYRIARRSDGAVQLQAGRRPSEPEIVIDGQKMALSGQLQGSFPEGIKFFARLRTGFSVEVSTKPQAPEIIDAVLTRNHRAQLTGYGAVPFGAVQLNPRDSRGILGRDFWDKTIGDLRHYWRINVSEESPFVYFPGTSGTFFRYLVQFKDLPQENARPIRATDTPKSTYSSKLNLKGTAATGTSVTGDAITSPPNAESGEFKWTFSAPKQAAWNQSGVDVVASDNRKFHASTQIDRRLPFEFSTRFVGLGNLQQGTSFLTGELALNGWFESLLGWQNRTLSYQRWGAGLRYTRSLLATEVGNASLQTYDGQLSMLTADLRYRFTPGTWGWVESWGLLSSFQQIQYGDSKASMSGLGFFWSRSMPKMFDELFNQVSFLRYPKWVDMSFVYYPFSTSGEVLLGQNWILNFHGRIFWTERFFGELGFGAKRFEFTDTQVEEYNDILALQGAAGIGISF